MYKKQAAFDLEAVSSGMFIQEKGWLSPKMYHEYEFNIKGSKQSNLPISFKLKSRLDDLDFSLWKINGKKKKTLLADPSNDSLVDEYIFGLLSPGKYALVVEYDKSYVRQESDSFYRISLDTKYIPRTMRLPDDALFGSQWHLLNTGQSFGALDLDIRAPEAWMVNAESPNVKVAVIDGAFDTAHPDLIDNLWINANEVPLNDIDDDGNGYIDDVNGWNFANQSNQLLPDEHGTHVAGIIGAKGNNQIGISGISWDVDLMSLDVFGEAQKYEKDNLFEAIYYAINNGANVINMSLGYTVPHATLDKFKQMAPDLYKEYFDVLTYAVDNGVVVVASAGNDDADDASSLSIPAAFSSIIPGFISVAAINDEGFVSEYSNFGSSVTIAAPGGSSKDKKSMIFSTFPTDQGFYDGLPGTSMAAPIVSGAAALMLDLNNKLTPADIELIISHSSFKSQGLSRFVQSGGFLNLKGALDLAKKYSPRIRRKILKLANQSESSIDYNGLDNRNIPLDQHVSQFNFVDHLFKKSKSDFIINYCIDSEGLYGDNSSLDPGFSSELSDIFHQIESNTILRFRETKYNQADFVIGGISDKFSPGVDYRQWGLSVAFSYSNNPGDNSTNIYNASLEIMLALGLAKLPDKTQGIYSMEHSISASPSVDAASESQGITPEDFDAINYAWSLKKRQKKSRVASARSIPGGKGSSRQKKNIVPGWYPQCRKCDLSQSNFNNSKLFKADLQFSELWKSTFKNADLRQANLSGSDLSESNFDKSNLFRGNLKWADLWKSSFKRANLSRSKFDESDLSYSDFSDAKLVDASFWNVDLIASNLQGADLTNADLSFSDLRRSNLKKAKLTNTDFHQSNLWGSDLRGVDFEKADLSRIWMSDSDLSRSNLRGADLSNSWVDGSDLRFADLSNADLWRADFSDTCLFQAKLNGAYLQKADLSNADLRGADLFSADLSHADLSNKVTPGKREDLVGADLSGADLREARFFKTDLWRADLTGSQVDGANFKGAYWNDTVCPDGTMNIGRSPCTQDQLKLS